MKELKDSLDILKPSNTEDFIEHHGVKGMKWGVRKEDDTNGTTKSTSGNRDRFTARKKKVTEGNGTGVHKRGEGMHVENAYGEEGVGPYDSFHNAVNTYGGLGAFTLGYAPVTMQLGKALKSEILKEIIASGEYQDIKRLVEEFEKLASERSKTWNQGSTAATMVFEEKASKLIRDINSKLTDINSKYVDKTKLVKESADKSYSPSKDIFEFLSPSSVLKYDEKTKTVTKGWKSPPTNPKNAIGKNYKNTSK